MKAKAPAREPGLARAGRLLSAGAAGLLVGASVGFYLPAFILFIQLFTTTRHGRGELDGAALLDRMLLSAAATSFFGAVVSVVHCLKTYR